MKLELDKILDPDAPPERIKAAKEKVAQLQKSYAKIVDKETAFKGKLGMQPSALEKEREDLVKDREELERTNDEDRKIINNEDATSYQKTVAEERVAQCHREIRWITRN